MAFPMTSAEAPSPDVVRHQELQLKTLLRDIDALHAELADVERRTAELEGRVVEDEREAARAASAEVLARRVAEELVRRGSAVIEHGGLARVDVASPQGPGPVDRAFDRVPAAAPPPDPESALGTPRREPQVAATPAWRRWARPAEVLVHLVILFVLIAVAMGALR